MRFAVESAMLTQDEIRQVISRSKGTVRELRKERESWRKRMRAYFGGTTYAPAASPTVETTPSPKRA